MMLLTRTNLMVSALLACLLPQSLASAQTTEILRAERLRSATEILTPGSAQPSAPLEAPVDPRQYLLVPGDRLLVGIWGDRPESYRTVVTPDGHLVVPDLLAVDVRGLTLAEGAEATRRALAPLYPGEPIELHLLELGTFRVAVTGAVARPGFFELNGAERLSDLFLSAEGLRPEASLRRIRIRSRQGALVDLDPTARMDAGREVDHVRWYVAGELEANPHLRPGDVVDVPTVGSYVEVSGAIGGIGGILAKVSNPLPPEANRPSDPPRVRVEWASGDRVADALAMAGGLGDAASGSGLLVWPDGRREPIDLLDPGDLAREIPAFSGLQVDHDERWIYVVGAVRAPGRYPFYAGLAPRDYVLLAGGETENGSSTGWKLIDPDGGVEDAAEALILEPGATLRVPERRSYWVTRVLAPLSSAAALTISVVALLDRR